MQLQGHPESMAGYTPLFQSLTTGTLCGRWPDIGLWPVVLSMSDKNGQVDVTPAYIAGVTGLPISEVIACMKRFCEPDPYSRTKDEDGARLRLIDEHRDWGWVIVNHSKYREKARKAAFDSARIADGRNAARMAERRNEKDPTRPAMTREHPPSNANSNSDSNIEPKSLEPRATRSAATRLPEGFDLNPERRKVCEEEHLDPERTFSKFRDYWLAASGAKARKTDWDATWRNWCRNEADRRIPSRPAKPEITWRPPADASE